jgi:DNA polymerase-3 subunit chi
MGWAKQVSMIDMHGLPCCGTVLRSGRHDEQVLKIKQEGARDMSLKRVEFINLREAGSDALTAAARLAAYHLEHGLKVYIEASDQSEAEEMDKRLWSFSDDSFVPHSLEGGPDQADEPALIGTQSGNPNSADLLILLHPRDPRASQNFKMAILLIPRDDGPELKACRDLYSQLREDGQMEVVHITDLP